MDTDQRPRHCLGRIPQSFLLSKILENRLNKNSNKFQNPLNVPVLKPFEEFLLKGGGGEGRERKGGEGREEGKEGGEGRKHKYKFI